MDQARLSAPVKGRFLKEVFFFGATARGCVAFYERAITAREYEGDPPDEGVKRCVRVQADQLRHAARPLRITLELNTAQSARLYAVLTGAAASLHIKIARTGALKTFSIVRGDQCGTWVLRWAQGRDVLTCPLTLRDAPVAAGITLMALEAANPGSSREGWMQTLRRYGDDRFWVVDAGGGS